MRRLPATIAIVAAAMFAVPAPAVADRTQDSIFQDDQYLLYSSPVTIDSTLGVLRSLGVDRIRVTVQWATIAPDPRSATPPARFDGADPASYPVASWARYDLVLILAHRHGIAVDFNLTAPGPLWAMHAGAPSAAADHWDPSAAAFEQFVQAVGTRYSGAYRGLPRVDYWSVWNEPNQPGWLAPQAVTGVGGVGLPISPALYRTYVEAALRGLYASGHTLRRDTILIGELAPEGYDQLGALSAMTPLRFLRALYCVDDRYRPLRAAAAKAIGCPPSGSFVRSNPGLFYATGFAHHPYYFFWPPRHSAADPDFVPLANLGRLEHALDSIFAAYGVHRRIPIYLTEYGYQTNPPDPYEIVTPSQQAAYLNLADYMAWRDPRVRSVAQFLLRDSLPDPRYPSSDPRYWDTFQTGLEYAGGAPKPAYAAYRMPIWIVRVRGRRALVWGQLRPARGGRQVAAIQWAPRAGRYRKIATVTTRNPRSYLTAWVRLPRRGGLVRIAWRGLASRGVRVG